MTMKTKDEYLKQALNGRLYPITDTDVFVAMELFAQSRVEALEKENQELKTTINTEVSVNATLRKLVESWEATAKASMPTIVNQDKEIAALRGLLERTQSAIGLFVNENDRPLWKDLLTDIDKTLK